MPIKVNQVSLQSFVLEGISLLLMQVEEGFKKEDTIGD